MRTITSAIILIVSSWPALATPKPPLVGGDVDRHGCRPSAGYQWCQKTKRCERPWELARAKGIPNSSKAFKAFCSGR